MAQEMPVSVKWQPNLSSSLPLSPLDKEETHSGGA